MKKLSGIFVITVLIMLLSENQETFAQSKNTVIGINAGFFIPGNDYLIGGVRTISYNAEGSPVGLFITGFGTGCNLDISVSHYFSGFGISLKSGINIQRQENDMSLAPDGERLAYDNTLDIIPVELSLAYKLGLEDSEVIPYFGMGIGFYYGSMEQKIMPEARTRTWTRDNAISGGVVCYSGLLIPVYHDLLLNLRAGYNIALGNWELENQDDQTVTRYEKLNTGGYTFSLGFAFRL